MKFHEDAMQSIREFRKSIINMSLITQQYLKAKASTIKKLIVIKALSYLFENPCCPMVSSYALSLINSTKLNFHTLTSMVNRMFIDEYQRERYLNALNHIREIGQQQFFKMVCNIDLHTRQLFAETYAIPIETQMEFERNPLSQDSREIFLRHSTPSIIENTIKNVSYSDAPIVIEETVQYGYVQKTPDLLNLEVVEKGEEREVTKVEIKKINRMIEMILLRH